MATSSPIQERPGFPSGIQRAFTLPPRSLSYHEKAGLDPSDSAADILYSHPSARILKFSPPYNAIRSVSAPVPQDLDYPVDTVETLPWASTTETTAASGPLIIEKVQGSTNFLKSGTVMHAILRNSQCWCVDGESKFVLRIRKFQYYRIELPIDTDEDRAKVEELKVLLTKILRFERTPCPFKRGFHVDLPESDITPRRKGTWKRRQSSQISAPVGETPPPLSRDRDSRGGATQGDNRFVRDRPEAGSSTTGSDYDEDEMHSESDSAQEHSSHSPVRPMVKPMVDHLDKIEADMNPKIQTREDETTNSEIENGQTLSDVCQPGLDQSCMLPAEPTKEDGKEDLYVEEKETANSELDNGQTTAEISESPPEQAEIIPAEPLLPDFPPSHEETKPMPEVGPVEQEAEAAKVDSSIVEACRKSDSQAETASIGRRDSTEITAGELFPPYPIALEPGLAESGDEELQPPELEPNDADDIDGRLQMEGDSRPSDTMSVASTSMSFHSFDAPESPTSPMSLSHLDSPPSPTPLAEEFDPLALHSHHAHKREVSELTVTPSTPHLEPLLHLGTASPDRPSTSASERLNTPPLAKSSASDGSWTEVETPSWPRPTSHIRRRLKARRSLSPLPPSPTLFTPQPHDRSNHLTSTILQKACSLALGKPVEAVLMLVHILARIAGGATVNDLLNGNLFKKPGQERNNQRNRSLPDQIDGKGDYDLDEDDFGVPIRGRSRSSKIAKRDDETDSLFDLD